ncbi:MAG: Ig-like domain-containing protein [Gemmatimonas sp.]|uniref:Ig-like domain-containing protein n=1 Tax=Gemmatimonas sp. TaxID=1962908 RepID=UPI00391EE217
MHIRYARLTGALAATLLVSACAGDRATSELVTGIPSASLVTARTGSAVSLRVRDSVQLTPVNLKRSVRWSSSNPGVAGVSRSGMVVGVAGGTALITASGGNGLERTTVSVASATPTVTSLTLSPGTAQLSTGGRQQFAVSARWSDGSTALPPVTYSATGGTISSTGLYTAGSLAGTFMVVATCACGVADTSAVAIQTAAPAPTVTALRISPKDVSVAASATVQLSTSASWSNGATTLPPISYAALDGGTVNATSGAFVAPATAGRYRVVVSSTATPVRDTASITVAAAQLVTLRIAPRTSSVAGGASVQFSATASWSTGATTLPPVTYQAPDGGSINASTGLWVAPATSGTFRVIVAHTGGSLRDTATVTVTATTPPPAPVPTAFTPNLPSGMRLVGDSDFDSPTVPGIEIINWDRNTVQSPTTHGVALMNVDGRSVVRAWFPERHAGNGVGPMTITTGEMNTRSHYMSVRLRYSANYQFHTNTEKLLYPVLVAPGAGAPLLNVGRNGELAGFNGPMNGPVAPLVATLSPAGVIPIGRWFHIEYYTRLNSPGQSDGEQRVWVDGRLVLDRRNVSFVVHGSQVMFLRGRLDFTRGGGPSTVLTPLGGQWVDVDRLAFYSGT